MVQSVHSFAESGIGGHFLAFMGFAALATMGLILTRREQLASDARIDNPLSREGVFMLNNWLLLGATFAVLLGTVYPTLSEAINGNRVVVEQPYFNAIMAPIGSGFVGFDRHRAAIALAQCDMEKRVARDQISLFVGTGVFAIVVVSGPVAHRRSDGFHARVLRVSGNWLGVLARHQNLDAKARRQRFGRRVPT